MTESFDSAARRVFNDALDVAAGERDAFVRCACGEDLRLVQVVSELLDAEAATGFLDEPDVDTVRTEATSDRRADASPVGRTIPEQIGRYRVIRECGHGGMGVVYEAEQDSPRRRVALKVVRSGATSREVIKRMRYEAEILGQLQHPGIGQIFEAGSFDLGEGGQPYFAMEFIDGVSITDHADAHELELSQRLELFARTCDAVHYAHQKGVVHRDLKPDNILVEVGTSGSGHPKVLDFGIARVTNSDLKMTTMKTDINRLIGTLQYMSPEQAGGHARDVDIRSDVYALGVILYQLLSGRLPYELGQRSIAESVLIIRDEEPRRLSSVHSALRGDLETMVGKCMEKQPEHRYQSALAIADDIRRFLRHDPIMAKRPSTWYQVRKFTRRNRSLVGGIVATFVVLVAGVIVATALAVHASNLARTSARNESSARAQTYRAEITAAHSLIESDPSGARARLEIAPVEFRN